MPLLVMWKLSVGRGVSELIQNEIVAGLVLARMR